MGFQHFVGGRMSVRCGYEKIREAGGRLERPRRRWVKNVNGRLKGFRLSRSRKLSLKAFSVIVLKKKIARICADVTTRLKMEGAYPTIVFLTQWGLPVLSHPSVKCRKKTISLDR